MKYILLTIISILCISNAYANDENGKKITVVKSFLDCQENGVCTGNNTNSASKKYLSQSAISTLDYEKRRFKSDDECAVAVPRCYSGLWTEPGNGGFMWNRPKFSVNGNIVSANFGKEDGVAYFKVVKENGQYKIDNTKHADRYSSGQWWR